MKEMVIAVFDRPSAADTAVRDLQVARIPSAVIRREVRDRPTLHNGGNAGTEHGDQGRDWPAVTVAVDEMHADAVTGILDQYGPLDLEERAA